MASKDTDSVSHRNLPDMRIDAATVEGGPTWLCETCFEGTGRANHNTCEANVPSGELSPGFSVFQQETSSLTAWCTSGHEHRCTSCHHQRFRQESKSPTTQLTLFQRLLTAQKRTANNLRPRGVDSWHSAVTGSLNSTEPPQKLWSGIYHRGEKKAKLKLIQK